MLKSVLLIIALQHSRFRRAFEACVQIEVLLSCLQFLTSIKKGFSYVASAESNTIKYVIWQQQMF